MLVSYQTVGIMGRLASRWAHTGKEVYCNNNSQGSAVWLLGVGDCPHVRIMRQGDMAIGRGHAPASITGQG